MPNSKKKIVNIITQNCTVEKLIAALKELDLLGLEDQLDIRFFENIVDEEGNEEIDLLLTVSSESMPHAPSDELIPLNKVLIIDKIPKEFTSSFRFLGVQGHFDLHNCHPFQHLRLSQLQQDMTQAEVFLRNSIQTYFSPKALKDKLLHQDDTHWPVGFTIEEYCRLAKYVGAGDKVKKVTFLGYEDTQKMPKVYALLIYYTLLGYYHWSEDTVENMIHEEYLVPLDHPELDLHFKKDIHNNRWWIEISIEQEKILVPCMESDYNTATEGELSTFLFYLISNYSI